MWSTVSIPFSTCRRWISRGVLAAFGVAYPFVVYAGIDRISPSVFVALAVGVLVLRLAWSRSEPQKGIFSVALVAVGVALLVLLSYDGMTAAKAYPVLMSLAFATVFGWSLAFPPTLVERIAVLAGTAPTEPARRYMRRVTVVWFAFLVANAGVSGWTGLAQDHAVWAFYNGFVSYLLMGILMGGEYLVRVRVRRRSGDGAA